MRKIGIIIISVLMLLCGSSLAFGVCETPPFVTEAVPPNVMVIVDNSGSMNMVIYHSAYDPAITYSGDGTYNSGTTYFAYDSSYNTYAYTANGRMAYLLYGPGDDGNGVRYSGNYLNWIYWHADQTQRENLPQQTRMQVAREVISGIVKDTSDFRFGLMKFNESSPYHDGGVVVASIGDVTLSNVDTYLNNIKAITWTPLAETLLEAWLYFKGDNKCYGGSGAYSSPIQYWCQKNFVIYISDGEPYYDNLTESCAAPYRQNWDGDSENEEGDPSPIGYRYLDDLAHYIYNNDARSDLDETQNIATYTIGFNLTGWGAQLLMDAADNGGSLYYTCWNAAELTESLQTVIGDIIQQLSSGTAVAVLSTSETTEDRLFRAKFLPGSWKGYLEAFSIPYTEGDTPVWEAGTLLESRSYIDRTIYTAVGGSKLDFTTSNWSTLQTPLGALSESEAKDIINYIRGDNSNEQSQGGTYRNREGWKLGDVTYSNPVVVGTPTDYRPEESYQTFIANNKDREKVIYVGANDGMLHAFRVSDGRELWGFIPSNLLGKLKDLTDPNYCHEYFVDLTPRVADVYIGGAWKTVLLGGERAGGKAYFALDVTDPNNPQYLWEFTHANLGESWSVPAVGKVNWSGVDKYVMFVGSGFENATDKGYFFAVDIADGTSVWEKVSNDTINAVTSCTAVDRDRDGYMDTVYAGDLMGSMWKFDVSNSNPASWSTDRLFHATDDAANDQPITVRPSISYDEYWNIVVYFGTGKYYDTNDKTTTQQQTFYCLIDDDSGEINKAELVDQTTDTGITALPSDKKGWYINLTANGVDPSERVISEAVVVSEAVFFTTFTPNNDICGYGGDARLYAVYYLTGGATNPSVLEGAAEGARYIELGVGCPSAPVVSIKHDQVIVQTSDTTIHAVDVDMPYMGTRPITWREVF